jgi:small subunit ribosomal protein S6
VIKYEATYIVDPNLAEDTHNGLLERMSGTITELGGSVIDVKNMGRRRLTHEVKGKIEGIYICMRFDSSPDAEAELNRQLRLAEEVLRGLIIRLN